MYDIKYKFYPTLLNEFSKYQKSKSAESKQKLLNRINRVIDFDVATLARFKKGVSFEDEVLKSKPKETDKEAIKETRLLLPKNYQTQQLVKFTHKEILFYGYADVVGESRVIDLKTTSNHKPGRHDFNFQNLYLFGLKDMGFKSMEYIIYDFNQIHVESYPIQDFDFNQYLTEMEAFAHFLEENRTLITDPKIFVKAEGNGLFG